jgi:hypothetical protein
MARTYKVWLRGKSAATTIPNMTDDDMDIYHDVMLLEITREENGEDVEKHVFNMVDVTNYSYTTDQDVDPMQKAD